MRENVGNLRSFNSLNNEIFDLHVFFKTHNVDQVKKDKRDNLLVELVAVK